MQHLQIHKKALAIPGAIPQIAIPSIESILTHESEGIYPLIGFIDVFPALPSLTDMEIG